MKTQHLHTFPENWRPVAAIFAALGDATRQKILLLFESGEELSIKDIAAQFPFGRSTIVHHLATLEKAGILFVRRDGKLALYSLRPEPVLEALENLRLYITEELLPEGEKRSETEYGDNNPIETRPS